MTIRSMPSNRAYLENYDNIRWTPATPSANRSTEDEVCRAVERHYPGSLDAPRDMLVGNLCVDESGRLR